MEPETTIPATEETARSQTRHSVIGEAIGFSAGIGAVYVAEHACPQQTRAMIARLAETLGKWRGTTAAAQTVLAHKIADVAIMKVGGVLNMGTQFALHRHRTNPADRAPLAHDLGRVLAGYGGGSVTAIGALAMAETFAPRWMDQGESRASRLLGNSQKTARFAELVLSNGVQSVGALAGNIPAQLLYDAVMNPGKKR